MGLKAMTQERFIAGQRWKKFARKKGEIYYF